MNNAFLRSNECLKSVYIGGAFSTVELNKQLEFSKPSDRALITKIVYGVLDCDIELDYILSLFIKKAKAEVKIYLKIGVYCLKYLSIPRYAVVNDVAELSKQSGDMRTVGFVNATLKRIADKLDDGDIAYPEDKTEYLSVKYSYPMWALKKLIKDYGTEVAAQIVKYKEEQSDTVRVNTDMISVAEFENKLRYCGANYTKTILPDAFKIKGKLPIDQQLYTNQSLSSMLVARALNVCGSVLDCCAAPGGKSVYIKQLGASAVTACDIHIHRVKLIESYARRMNVDVNAICCDSTVFNQSFQSQFDGVLCDVPCSGFGVLDSRPDIKLFRQNKDISDLMKLQYAILDNCSRYVKSGGILLYSTCTVFKNENEQIVNKFLKEHDNFEFAPINLPIQSNANGRGMYQFLPYVDGVQGFFCARLKRIM
ncbi:MAG: 16S rRNA (cytosine(967)-C(5))-methyltransferase RsmB [Corallococcus sp.]|nr:16S rRNA (cytosine(967)-C(5))-methyltransferase RsmB [Corallococcus sp.]